MGNINKQHNSEWATLTTAQYQTANGKLSERREIPRTAYEDEPCENNLYEDDPCEDDLYGTMTVTTEPGNCIQIEVHGLDSVTMVLVSPVM